MISKSILIAVALSVCSTTAGLQAAAHKPDAFWTYKRVGDKVVGPPRTGPLRMRWFSVKERKPSMMKKHHTTEQIIRILREAEGSQMKANLVSGSNAQTPFTGNRTDRFFRLAE